MTTEAQIQANQGNAQKSTGPRTPEGKEKASQNSLKHGLFAREGIIRGEDWEEYEMHREMLLEQLAPTTPLEVILATRVVDLSWRLRRAGQDQNEAFGAMYDRYTAGEPQEPQERGAILGRMVLEDFEHEAVLERLQRYERRIESSFYRTLNELRRVHDQRCKAQQELAGTLDRWRQEDGEARKARALACDWRGAGSPSPAGATTNAPGAEVAYPSEIPAAPFAPPLADAPPEDEMCKTNPIGGPGAHDCGLRIPDCGLENAGLEQQTSAVVLQDSTTPSFPYSPGAPAPADEMCETNPISEGLSSWKCEVPSESCKTNPIGGPGACECGLRTADWRRVRSACGDGS